MVRGGYLQKILAESNTLAHTRYRYPLWAIKGQGVALRENIRSSSRGMLCSPSSHCACHASTTHHRHCKRNDCVFCPRQAVRSAAAIHKHRTISGAATPAPARVQSGATSGLAWDGLTVEVVMHGTRKEQLL